MDAPYLSWTSRSPSSAGWPVFRSSPNPVAQWQLRSYEVSRSVLLLRANQTNQTNALKTRVDLMSRGVRLLRLPDSFEDLTISSVPDAKAAADPEIAEAMLGGYQVYGLDSSGTPTG